MTDGSNRLARMATTENMDRALQFDWRKEEVRALLDINQAISRHLERDRLFGALADCLKKVLPADRFGIELPIESDKLQGHILSASAAGQPTEPTILRPPALPAIGCLKIASALSPTAAMISANSFR